MPKKISENPIPDIHADWGNDERNGMPYSGQAVQTFLKKQLQNKFGVLYHDESMNMYLCFTDAESRDTYLADPLNHTDLVIGRFDAPSVYYASIVLQTPTQVTVFNGGSGNTITFTFGVYVTKGDTETGDSVVCTYNITSGNKKKTVVKQYSSGEVVNFNMDEYLKGMTGKVVVRITLTGLNTQATTSSSVTYTLYNVQLEEHFDITQVYNTSLEIPFTLSGDGVKGVEFWVDGNQTEYNRNEDEVTASTGSKTKYISTEGLTDGVHVLQLRSYVIVQEQKRYASMLYREFFVCRSSMDVSYLALSVDYPMGSDIVTTGVTLPGVEQFIASDITFATYTNTGDASVAVEIGLNDTLLGTIDSLNDVVNHYPLTTKTSGIMTLRIGGRSLTLDVQPSTLSLSELTDKLTLSLDASSKSNTLQGKESWTSGNIVASLSGFSWTPQSGWKDGWLVIPNGASVQIPFAPLSTDEAKTIEIEFGTEDVRDDDAVVCDMRNSSGTGILITASEIQLVSRSAAQSGSSDTGRVGTRFKSGEKYRISFVITPKAGATNKCMSFVYVNGILSGATTFASTDNFVSDKQINISGSEDCVVMLRQIRCYDKALSDDEILNNYILYRPSVSEMLSCYERNNVIENGDFSVSKLEGELPVAIITGNIPAIEATTDKKHVEYVDIDFYNLQDRTKSFSWKNVYMTPQGTSSMTYPRKNLRPYTNKSDSTRCYDADGKECVERKYAHMDGAQPCDRWTWKADFAESSGTHNAGIAMLWNKVLYNSMMNGQYVFRTEAQKTAAANDFPYDVRTTVAGFPMVVFYRLTKDDDLVFMGKYNFLNDKSSESVFGFKDVSGVTADGEAWAFDNSKVECWECLANKEDIALMKSVDGWNDVLDTSKGTKRWQQSFEGRYPDGNTDDTALKALVTWVASTKDNLSKWKAEKSEHFNLPLLCAYYVYLMRFGAVDQPVKNSMLTTEDGIHWFFINYDNDTINGVRNDGLLKYDPFIDRQSKDAELNDYCYAGHDSVLWNNFEADDECMAMVREVDAALQQGGLTYDKVLKVFNDDFSSKWCERVYNQDAEYKYIAPYTDKGLNYLSSLQGSRKAHREWWLSQRFSLLDAKYVDGDFRADVIQMLIPADGVKQYNFSITAAQELYFGWGVNNVVKESGVHLKKGESHTFTTNQAFAIGDPVRIYAGPEIAAVDIHEMGNVLSHLNVNGAWSQRKGTGLEKLIIGGEGVTNTALTTGNFTGLGNCSKLKCLDIRGMQALTEIDTSALSHLETLLADGSGLTSFTLKDSPMKSLSLPSSLQALDIEDLRQLTSLNINASSLSTLIVKNCGVDLYDFLKNWTLDTSKTYNIDIEGIDWKGKTTAEALSLGQKMKSVGATLKGSIEVDSITVDNYQQIMDVFGENCFNKRGVLRIYSSKSSFIVLAPTTVVEGQSGKITVIGADDDIVTFVVSSGGDRMSINQRGSFTTTETGDAVTAIVRIGFNNGKETNYETVNINIAKAVYPTLSIEGLTTIDATSSYKAVTTAAEGQNASFVMYGWTISGEAVDGNYVKLSATEGTVVNVDVISSVTSPKPFRLVLTGYKSNGKGVTASMAVTLKREDQIVCYDNTGTVPEGGNTNQPLIELAKAQGWMKKDGVNLWRSDCEAVTSLSSKIPNTLITFDEFQWFTSFKSCNFKNCSHLTSITIPNSVTSLGYNCFYGCTSLTSITIPNSVTSLDMSCFQSCSSLTSITIPDSVTSLRENCFYGCTSLTSITIPNSVTSLGYNCFRDCTSLTSVILSNSVTSLPSYCFSGCTSLASITIPDSVTSLENFCFSGCTSLASITIPDSVTSLTSYCFQLCSGLTSITIPNSVTSLGDSCFYSCTSLASITIPDSVTSLGNFCFYGCTSLTSITIPNSVTSLGYCFFSGCTSLASITISDSVTKLGGEFFKDCTSLTSITIPDSVTSLGENCFNDCSGLKKIYFESVTPPTILSDTFSNWNGNVYTLNYVGYQQATNWSAIANRIMMDDRYTYTFKSLNITADDVVGNSTKTKVHWTEVVTKTKDGVSTDVTFSGDDWSSTFEQNTSKTETVQRTVTYTKDGFTATTTITQGVWVDKNYTVDLNNQWQTSSDIANPDSTSYDGVYESNSNYHVSNGVATMSINIVGYDSFKVLVRSNGESNYDYVIVGKIDAQPTTSDYQADTKGAATGGTAVSDYKEVMFSGLGGTGHIIYIAYRKDNSSDSGTDRGYVLIPKNQ